MGAPVGPVLDDVVVVRNVDVVEIDSAELRHLRDQRISKTLPAGAARIGRTTLGLEDVPVPRLLRRDHELRIDSGGGTDRSRRGTARASGLAEERSLAQHGTGGDACGSLEERASLHVGLTLLPTSRSGRQRAGSYMVALNGVLAMVFPHINAMRPPSLVMSRKVQVSCSTPNGNDSTFIGTRATSLSGVYP